MNKGWKIGTCLALLIALAPMAASAEEPASKKTFFSAVERRDFDGAARMITGDVGVATQAGTLGQASLTVPQFIDRIRDCYVRSLFAKDEEPNSVVAAWMCPLQRSGANPNRSRVIVVKVNFEDDRVRLSQYSQSDSTRRAPPPTRRPAN